MKTVRGIVAVVLALIIVIEVGAQSKRELKAVLDTVIVKAKQSSLYGRSVNWDSVQRVMHERAKYAKNVTDLRASFEVLLTALKDRQGIFYDPSTSSGIAGYPSHQQAEVVSSKTASKLKVNFESRILKGGIRYLRIAEIPFGADINVEAAKIRKAMDSLNTQGAENWIVDLRFVTGGDALPAMAGLAPLFGQGVISTVSDNKNKIRSMYSVHNGKLHDNQKVVAQLSSPTREMKNAKVVVLTSRFTAGAGEILAIMLKGRKNSKFYGERTAGELNGTNYIKISESLVMSISETKYLDRLGNSYKDQIKPDSYVTFDPTASLNKDQAVNEAIQWLSGTNATASAH
jgi:carboxyl-terminal processing protease